MLMAPLSIASPLGLRRGHDLHRESHSLVTSIFTMEGHAARVLPDAM